MKRRSSRALALALVLALAPTGVIACKREPVPVGGTSSPPARAGVATVTALDPRHEPLRARFDADADTPRLLVLASPT